MMAAIHETAEDLHTARVMPTKTLYKKPSSPLWPPILGEPEGGRSASCIPFILPHYWGLGGLQNRFYTVSETLREFDALCLTPVQELTPEEIRSLRLREEASQAVFARYLNVTTGIVSQWERGEKHPCGASLKLLTLIKNKGLSSVA